MASPPIKVDNNSSETHENLCCKNGELESCLLHVITKKVLIAKNPASKKALEKFEESAKSKKEAIEEIEKADIAAKKWKTKIQKNRLEGRLEKIETHLKLQKETRDYNLGTSLRNYIDPRVMKAWLTYVDLDWKTVYTATLRRKFRVGRRL